MSERGRLLRVGVDTNLHVSAAISALGNPRRLRDAWQAGNFRLLISAEQRAEIAEVLRRPRIARKYGVAAEDVDALLRRLEQDAVRVRPARRLPLHVRDRDDDKILATALGGKADYLVTGDDDLLALAGDPRLGSLRIVTAREFLEILRAEEQR